METYAYGFPRIGKNREYKKAIEGYWKGNISENDMLSSLDRLQEEMLKLYNKYTDHFPVGEMTLYDNMFDASVITGIYKPSGVKEYFECCRGKNALDMTKWFNTNYHYLVPDLNRLNIEDIKLNWNKPKEYIDKFSRGIPYILGPFTLLELSSGLHAEKFPEYLEKLGEIYSEVCSNLEEIHIEEPAFVRDLPEEKVKSIKNLYSKIGSSGCKINLMTYYSGVDFLSELYELPIKSIGLDFIHGSDNLEKIRKYGFPGDKILIAGVVNGRNVWRTDISKVTFLLTELSKYAGQIFISNASPLYHVPVSLEGEELEMGLMEKLAFAEEKLLELKTIKEAFLTEKYTTVYSGKDFGKNDSVRKRISSLEPQDFKRSESFSKRREVQKDIFKLPLFPTTTIGSFPQTGEIRSIRADFKNGKVKEDDYDKFIQTKISELVRFQEDSGLDVLVHGEYERSDMVEYFALKLEGIAATKNGWIVSYGTRGYRPPIIYGDVWRPEAMSVKEVSYAQTLTKKPVKGMLTGPVTIIAWSFVRDDIEISDVAYQIALCLRDEIKDYEKAGIKIVQVDEPAFREKAPVKTREWDDYFNWAINSFNLTAAGANPETQIHSHMCYSDFENILDKIEKMDFDVISIEAARSRGSLVKSFEKTDFVKHIGLGVWDIHSPAVPSVEDMKTVIESALKVIPKENFWINPDCGLKTRDWKEVSSSIKNMVEAAKSLR